MNSSSFLLKSSVILLALGLFAIDVLVPLGVAVWLPYVGVVLLSIWLPARWQTYTMAAACTALMLLGLFYSPPGNSPFWIAAVNRLLGIFAVWMAAIVGLAARRTLQLEEANRKLQEEIGERERLQAQLLRSQRLDSIGVLAGGIAHDFNNLLTPILMAIKLLKEDRPDQERQQLLTTLQASAERGAEMVRQLLAFAGGTNDRREPVDPSHIIKEIKAILEHTLPKAIQIQLDIADNTMAVRADATQIAQVLMNLCVNARDAMPTGGTLTIRACNSLLNEDLARTHPNAKPGAYVLIEVGDSGVGISADVFDKVFDPFFTTKGPGKGTGLGLSTALGIVRGHDGFINVWSEVGRGSRFAVYLPAIVDEAAGPPENRRINQLRGHGELVLLVDDEPLILETARVALRDGGYRVIAAADGRNAIELYQRHLGEIRVVLLDMMMPGMDGEATMLSLEDLDPNVRIIASSGLRVAGRVSEAISGGRMAFLPKPYTDEQLLATLATVLKKNEGG